MRFVLVLAARAAARAAAVRARVGGRRIVPSVAPAAWPFVREIAPSGAVADGGAVVMAQLHDAFPAGQTSGTRLVLTQPSYQMRRWLDWLERHPATLLVADADPAALWPRERRDREPWTALEIVDVEAHGGRDPAGREEPDGAAAAAAIEPWLHTLGAAFRATDAGERLQACRRVASERPDDPAVLLALASASMEQRLLDDAGQALARAERVAPLWEAVHFELGKLWLRRDDSERAAAAFARAGELMPSFSAAFSNLGAVLGELDRGDEAVRALRQALAFAPRNHTVLNNLGVALRELGELDDAAATFGAVVAASPEFVFGHYNLAHTLLLQARFVEARDAYREGQRRDPDRNPRQAARLAVATAAAGDPGAVPEIQAAAARVTADERRDLLEEAEEILAALREGGAGADDHATGVLLEAVRAALREA